MSEIKQKIITVDAKAFFKYFPKEIAENQKCFTLKYTNRALYKLVVQQENETEDCPLFHQFFKEIEKSWNLRTNDEPFRITNTTLFDKFVIVDFGDIFLPLDEISSFPGQKERHEDYLENAKDIVENGCDIYFKNHEKPVHMIAFDKSGNMSRHSRISFIDENYYAGLNTRLNLGMDFSKIPVKESKYYSYRGLSLSSSKRINHKKLIIDANTIVVLHDVRKDEKNPSKPITGYYYDKGITIATAKLDVEEDGSKEKINCTFLKTKREELLEVDIPFDGAGFISPEYASYINEALGTTGATSFQIRLPFMKGMLHEVDVHQFLEEYNIHKDGKENWYKDVFGKMRDLSKAHIFITESMFKGMKWLIKHLSNLEDNKYGHPMEFYCDAMNKYEHAINRGPLRERYMVLRKDRSDTPTEKEKERFTYLYSMKPGKDGKIHSLQEKTREKLLKNIAMYLLSREYHPKEQKFILLYGDKLLEWYGLDDYKRERKKWYFPECVWGNPDEKPIMEVYSQEKGWQFVKMAINQEFLEYFEFRIIDEEQIKDYDKSKYWIIKDTGHGQGSLKCI